MSIPTQRAGPREMPVKEVGSTAAEQRGYETKEMPPPEFTRRHRRLAEDIARDPGRYVPMNIRK